MSLQIPARLGTLRRLLLLGGAGGLPRLYSTGDRRHRVIREAHKDDASSSAGRQPPRQGKGGPDASSSAGRQPPRRGRGGPDASSSAGSQPPRRGKGGPDASSSAVRQPPKRGRGGPDASSSAGRQPKPLKERPVRSAQKAVGETLLEKLNRGDGPSNAAATGAGAERKQPKDEPAPAQPVDVDEIFRKMKETGLIPNAVSMVDGLCKNGLVQDAMKLLGLMREKGAIPEVVIYTAVVETFCNAAKLDDAVRIFRKMQGNGVIPNAFSYWLLIQGLYKGGRLDDAIGFSVEMFEAGLALNAETFVGLVDAVCNKNGVDEGEKLVRSFQDRNFAVDEKSIGEHLGKKGRFSPVVSEVIFGKRKSGRPF